MTPDRRRFARVIIKWPIILDTIHGSIGGETVNLSPVGAFIRCADVPDLEDTFRLVINPTEERLLLATAKKVWSDTFFIDTVMFYGMGVRLTYIPDDDRQFLKNVISSYL